MLITAVLTASWKSLSPDAPPELDVGLDGKDFLGEGEAGVVGVPHPHTGEAVKAFVVTAVGAEVDEETLIEYCLDHLARYKCPNKIMFVDELPRNASGKLVRRNLADAMAAK